MAVSRIFVRDLPPSISEQDFSSHFSQRYPVTDVKIIPHRRIGYVGFKTAEDAAKAVNYFDKSFIRMSRIRVDFARDMQSIKPRPSPATPLVEVSKNEVVQNPRKRKRVEVSPNETKDPAGSESSSSSEKKVWQHTSIEGSSNTADKSEKVNAQTTDADWIRSHTNHLLDSEENGIDEETLGMVGDEMETCKQANLETKPHSTETTGTREQNESESSPSITKDETQDSLHNRDENEDKIRSTRRLFLRNLSYTVNDDDLEELFGSSSILEEVHVPLDRKSGAPKGFALVQFKDAEQAVQAYKDLDGTVFQGRLLHVLPAFGKRDSSLEDFAISQLPLKKQKQIQRKAEAATKRFNWNSLYMNSDAVLSSVSSRLGIAKSDLLDPTSSDSAVKLAQAETLVIQETKTFFESNGINLGAFAKKERGDTAILVKNFEYGTTVNELRTLFEQYGQVSKVLMPPSGTIAIVNFELPTEARSAFQALAYRKHKSSMLFLEKAPKNLFSHEAATQNIDKAGESQPTQLKASASELMEPRTTADSVDTSTVFVKNINFETTAEQFEGLFRPLAGFVSARLKTKPDSKHPGKNLSMGFGFLEFRTSGQAQAAVASMNGHNLHGHQLLLQLSNKYYDAAERRRKEDADKKKQARKSKIIIKNLPFEASKKDLRELFRPYGQLRAVRLPKKFDNSRKGFAFAEFTTPREAENAMEALRDTHLLGRRLVLDYAAGDALDPEKEIEDMQRKVSKQSESVALQKLVTSERKKFDFGELDE